MISTKITDWKQSNRHNHDSQAHPTPRTCTIHNTGQITDIYTRGRVKKKKTIRNKNNPACSDEFGILKLSPNKPMITATTDFHPHMFLRITAINQSYLKKKTTECLKKQKNNFI
jgi:hypothetical protein